MAGLSNTIRSATYLLLKRSRKKDLWERATIVVFKSLFTKCKEVAAFLEPMWPLHKENARPN